MRKRYVCTAGNSCDFPAKRIRKYREDSGHRYFQPIPDSTLLWVKQVSSTSYPTFHSLYAALQVIPLALFFDSMLIFLIYVFNGEDAYPYMSYSLHLLYPLVRAGTMVWFEEFGGELKAYSAQF